MPPFAFGARIVASLAAGAAAKAEELMGYAAFLVDADRLFDEALGSYDEALVRLAGKQTQKVKKETANARRWSGREAGSKAL